MLCSSFTMLWENWCKNLPLKKKLNQNRLRNSRVRVSYIPYHHFHGNFFPFSSIGWISFLIILCSIHLCQITYKLYIFALWNTWNDSMYTILSNVHNVTLIVWFNRASTHGAKDRRKAKITDFDKTLLVWPILGWDQPGKTFLS